LKLSALLTILQSLASTWVKECKLEAINPSPNNPTFHLRAETFLAIDFINSILRPFYTHKLVMAMSTMRAVLRLRAPVTVGRYGRAAPYRRIQPFAPSRQFSSAGYSRFQASSPKQSEGPKTDPIEEKDNTSESHASKEGQKPEPAEENIRGEESEAKSKEESTSEESSEGEAKEKKDDAPPPPHGEKTPWQVFMDTLKTGFEESKEWKDSTKALQSGYQDFTQNPTLQKAKSAYSDASTKATSTTSAAIKGTGKVIGKSATWAWETPVAKVVRKGASVAGEGLEKVTRPVRETEAYKSVKDVIDDGSSSRYGGWTEREERRARRAKRDAALGIGQPAEKMEVDPE
jgi:mitochondrial import inner membrane translocase subunit TIM44